MQRQHLELYHQNAAWRSNYESALATAEIAGAPMTADVLDAAAQAADHQIAAQAEATAREAVALDETRARLAAMEAERVTEAKAHEPASVRWARIVAAMNAERGATPPETPRAVSGEGDRVSVPVADQGALTLAQCVIARMNAER